MEKGFVGCTRTRIYADVYLLMSTEGFRGSPDIRESQESSWRLIKMIVLL